MDIIMELCFIRHNTREGLTFGNTTTTSSVINPCNNILLNLKNLSVEQLQQLLNDTETEIKSRT